MFQLRSADRDLIVVAKLSSEQEVDIPTSRVEEVLLVGSPVDSEKAIIHLNGRLQWVSADGRWTFHDEKPDPHRPLGMAKTSHHTGPHVLGLQKRLEQLGYIVHWTREDNLPSKMVEGWEVVYDDDGRYLESPGPTKSIFTCKVAQ